MSINWTTDRVFYTNHRLAALEKGGLDTDRLNNGFSQRHLLYHGRTVALQRRLSRQEAKRA